MRWPAVALAALALVGCNGGTVDRHALTNDAATIDSINCEAWLLSRAAADSRSTASFTSEQAGALRVQASNFADALGRRPTGAGLQRRVRAKAVAAGLLAHRLRTLQAHPGDRVRARLLAEQFRRAGSCA